MRNRKLNFYMVKYFTFDFCLASCFSDGAAVVQLPLVPICVTVGCRKGIWHKLVPCASKSPIWVARPNLSASESASLVRSFPFISFTLLVAKKTGCLFFDGEWHFDRGFARLIAPVATTTSIILSSKIQYGNILVPANPGPPGKWPLKRRERYWSEVIAKAVLFSF